MKRIIASGVLVVGVFTVVSLAQTSGEAGRNWAYPLGSITIGGYANRPDPVWNVHARLSL